MTETKGVDKFDPRAFVRTLTSRPGVYSMMNASAEVIYVGKARNLKRRVASYFGRRHDSPKTRRLVDDTRAMEVTVTHTEAEALLLENNLIKRHRPRYNVLLRDDKSYPYIYLSSDAFPRLAFHRGARSRSGRYFGPYPNAGAVRETLNLLQKLFQVRQCEDSFFRNRTRPCLQHQIERCCAPCVGLANPDTYTEEVRNAELFLEGRSNVLVESLAKRMEQCAESLEFERAAYYRDQIAKLRRVQERQYVSGTGGDLDVVGCAVQGDLSCVQVLYFRGGRSLGSKAFFPRLPSAVASPEEILGAFIPQYYLGRDTPPEILVSHAPEGSDVLVQALSDSAGHRVAISHRLRGERARWQSMAMTNAEQGLAAHLSSRAGLRNRFEALQDALDLDELPERLECFDISHTMGEATVASCVVFNLEGPAKSDYRRFNIEGIVPGDDYAAMRQALSRRYTRLKRGEGRIPDVLLIDGGPGQLAEAARVLEELQVDGPAIVGVAKGPDRRPGMEVLHLLGADGASILGADSPALHLIQQVRDEAHRFAITGHRQRRAKRRRTSALEEIPGVGPKRRQTLLRQFGGLRQLARAGVEDIAAVEGFNRSLAQRIYDALRDNA